MLTAGRWYFPRYPRSPNGDAGHCNARGLTSAGEALVRDLMRKGVLIDLEHMSDRATERTVELAQANCADLARGRTCYPLLTSHTWPRDLKRRLRDGEEVGFVRPGRGDRSHHRIAEVPRHARGDPRPRRRRGRDHEPGAVVSRRRRRFEIADDCPTSSESVARALAYAVEQMGGKGGVGFGTDFNGFAGQPGPRFGRARVRRPRHAGSASGARLSVRRTISARPRRARAPGSATSTSIAMAWRTTGCCRI